MPLHLTWKSLLCSHPLRMSNRCVGCPLLAATPSWEGRESLAVSGHVINPKLSAAENLRHTECLSFLKPAGHGWFKKVTNASSQMIRAGILCFGFRVSTVLLFAWKM